MRKRIAALGVCVLAMTSLAGGQGRIGLGILPTRDTTGEPHGTTLARALPEMIFQKLKDAHVQPVFLNPGGAYSPADEEGYSEYARAMKVDAVLVTSLVGRARKTRTLDLEGFVLNPKTGARSPKLGAQTDVNPKDLDRAWFFEGATFFGPNRAFDKMGVGKGGRRLAESMAASAAAQLGGLVESGTAPPLVDVSGRCEVKVRVRYLQKGSASKTYILIVNGREESLGIVDGVAAVRLPSGPVVTHVSVKDAPYRLPIQDSYSANTFLDCSSPDHNLVLEIWPIGEAFLKWYP